MRTFDSGVISERQMIFTSLALCWLLDMIPLPINEFFWLPPLSALMLFYWLINRPQHVQVVTAFVLGLLVDIGTGSLWGLHALAYTLTAFILLIRHGRIRDASYAVQALVVLGALLTVEVIMNVVYFAMHRQFISWLYFVAPFFGALIWPLFNKGMLKMRHLLNL